MRRLREPEVRRVLEPVLAATEEPAGLTYSDDRRYVCDLGLVAESSEGGLRIAEASG
ncbi:hypothetical protein [Frankia sp. R82]|uniref:hypothetical protein n=1 Tax=Frankia sp. R82 TaxID=2950553 RepID=UPI002044172A|nr:hypothetical protein [Frankia sp. R82]MCM3885381.1 hypothetical protein [Frankia sp. R82]